MKYIHILICSLITSLGNCQLSLGFDDLVKSEAFFENGEIESSGYLYAGNKIGQWCYWYADGTKDKIGFYRLSQTLFMPESLIYDSLILDHVYEDVYIQEKIDSIDGQLIVQMQEIWAYSWYSTGSKKTESDYDSSNSSTLYLEYYENGKISDSTNFKNGLEFGKSYHWNEAGRLTREFTYENGKLDGNATIWDENGFIQQTFHYNNGKKHGEWKYYSEGVLVKTEFWSYGNLTKEY